MTNPLGILYVHGIHSQRPGFSEPLHELVLQHLNKVYSADYFHDVPGPVVAREVYWADIFKPMAEKLAATSPGSAGWAWLRNVMLTTVTQAVGYEDDQELGTHELVHQRVAEALSDLESAMDPGAPLIIVAHSLGSVLMSDYIWNHQNPGGKLRSTGKHLKNLRGLITMGSPLALYATRWTNFGVPINMAGETHCAPWRNLLAQGDVLAWPLKELNDRYHTEVTDDIYLKPSWRWRAWPSPIAHISYWTSPQVAATIGDMVKTTWETM